jgi:hypothetical protein
MGLMDAAEWPTHQSRHLVDMGGRAPVLALALGGERRAIGARLLGAWRGGGGTVSERVRGGGEGRGIGASRLDAFAVR